MTSPRTVEKLTATPTTVSSHLLNPFLLSVSWKNLINNSQFQEFFKSEVRKKSSVTLKQVTTPNISFAPTIYVQAVTQVILNHCC